MLEFFKNMSPETSDALMVYSLTAMDPRGGMAAGAQAAMQAYNSTRKQRMAEEEMQRGIQLKQQIAEIANQHRGSDGKFDTKGFANSLMATGSPELIAQAQTMLKNAPKLKNTINAIGSDGKPKIHSVMDTGEISDTGLSPAEKLHFGNLGNRYAGFDQFTGEEKSSAARGMNPGEAARLSQSASQFAQSHDLARRNYALNVAKASGMMGGGTPGQAGVPGQPMQTSAGIPGMENNPFQAEALKAAARESGKLQAKAVHALPGVENSMGAAMRASEELLTHPGFDESVGVKSPIGYVKSFSPNTDAAGWKARFEQVQGQQFLAAIEYMRGFGQLTEREGQVAASAVARMNRATSQQEFKLAVRDFQKALADSTRKIQTQAGRGDQPVKLPRIGAQVNVPENVPRKQNSFEGFSIEKVE